VIGRRSIVCLALLAGFQLPALAQDPPPPPPGGEEVRARTRKVTKFVIEGNTLLPEAELHKVLRIYEGRDLTLDEMKEAAADLTSLYQRQGYYLVRALIPKQAFDSDQITIQVIEAKIGKVTVEGAEHYDPEFIRRRFEAAIENDTFRSEAFTRSLSLLNELPDLDVKAVMQASTEKPGTADFVLQVKDENPFHIGLDYNNYGTSATGIHRMGLNVDAGNLLTQADALSIRGVVGFPSRNNNFVQVGYTLPLDLNGTTAGFSYANGAFAVSEGLGQILDVRGNADIFTFLVSHPLERSLDFSSNLGLAVSHKNITNNFFGGQVPFSHDQYTMARLAYGGDWRGPAGRTIMQASIAQGLGGTGASDPLVSRVGASSGFTRFNLDAARIHRLSDGLYGVLRGSAQYATTPLFVAEQFALGGPDTVRGYQQAELLGDNAYLVGAELRWSPDLDNPEKFQMVFFVDHGGVSLVRPQPGDLTRGNTLTGAGFGFRWGMFEKTNLRFDLGFPLRDRPQGTGGGPAVYTGLQTQF
jgi:hemolysin activation/secretion protein